MKECIELGADGGINYKTEDFVERVKALTDGKGMLWQLAYAHGLISRTMDHETP